MPEIDPAPQQRLEAANASTSNESGSHEHARPDFDSVYDEHFGIVWRTLRALGVQPGALDDAVQDVFLTVHRQLPGFQARSSVKTWVCGIACHVASNYRRRERRKGGLLPLEAAPPLLGPDPHDQLEQAQAWAFVGSFLERLDEGKRAVYVLSRLEGLTATDIAEALKLPVNTVYSRIHAVEGALRSLVSSQGQGVFP